MSPRGLKSAARYTEPIVAVVGVKTRDMPWEDDEMLEDDIVDEDLDDDSTDLLPCPECGTMIYEDSDQCPRCGQWITPLAGHVRRRSTLWWVGAGLALVGMLMWAIF